MEMNLWTLFSALVFPCQPGGVCMGAITNLKQQEVCEGGGSCLFYFIWTDLGAKDTVSILVEQ